MVFKCIILSITCSSCLFSQSPTQTVTPTLGPIVGEIEYGFANVNDVKLVLPDSESDSILIIFTGNLPDDCTRIGEIKQENSKGKYIFTVKTARPKNETCNLVQTPFEEDIPLDELTGNIPDSLIVVVNGTEYDLSQSLTQTDVITQSVVSCPQEQEGYTLYTDNFEGFCFLFPESYTVNASTGDYVVLTGKSFITGEDEDQLLITLMVEVVTVELDDTAKDLASALYDINAYAQESVDIGGITLFVLHNLQDITAVRKGFIVNNESGYILTMIPEDSSLPEQTVLADELWNSVISSWTFLY